MCAKPSVARSGARKSCETEYENDSSSLLIATSSAVRSRTRCSSSVACRSTRSRSRACEIASAIWSATSRATATCSSGKSADAPPKLSAPIRSPPTITHARADVQALAPDGGEPRGLAGLKVDQVDDRARHAEQQRPERGLRDRLGRFPGEHAAVHFVQQPEPLGVVRGPQLGLVALRLDLDAFQYVADGRRGRGAVGAQKKVAPWRVVLDTDVAVSALVFREGHLTWLREAWEAGKIVPVVSAETISELVRVFGYPKLRLAEDEAKNLLAAYMEHAGVVRPPRRAARVPECRDEDDRVFLRAAYAARADALVTGDADLLAVASKSRVAILTPEALRKALPDAAQDDQE
jgi:putative PIN family toxin of toxin-antitoxin system